VTLTLRFERKEKGKLAILLNLKNNVLPWSEVTRVTGEEYPIREHLFKSDRTLRRMVLSEGSKEKKRGGGDFLRQSAVKGNLKQSEFDTREQKYENASELACTNRL
jgi:hypothetical protein